MGGEVPERATFNQKDFRVALVPYLALTQAVRAGNLLEFNSVLKTHTPVFKADKTFTLVIRLSHNVIKTGLRRINVSYSRISMIDICSKLHLDSAESAELSAQRPFAMVSLTRCWTTRMAGCRATK